MLGAATIVITRGDLTVAGAGPEQAGPNAQPDNGEYLFELVKTKRPDVIVVDCRGSGRSAVGAIEKIRARTKISILAVCETDDPLQLQYRAAGAVDCLIAPFDILRFNHSIQEIAKLSATDRPTSQAPKAMQLGRITFQPRRNTISANGTSVKLTTAENNLLNHFTQKPGEVCSRGEIARVLYGSHRPISDRAIDVIVARLRGKLTAVADNADDLIKTEFRLGYMFVGDVAEAAIGEPPANVAT